MFFFINEEYQNLLQIKYFAFRQLLTFCLKQAPTVFKYRKPPPNLVKNLTSPGSRGTAPILDISFRHGFRQERVTSLSLRHEKVNINAVQSSFLLPQVVCPLHFLRKHQATKQSSLHQHSSEVWLVCTAVNWESHHLLSNLYGDQLRYITQQRGAEQCHCLSILSVAR